MAPTEVESLEQLNEIIGGAGEKLIVIDFHATWCGPCKVIGPEFVRLAESTPNMIAVKVDVDEAEDIAAKYDIQAMPTFVFIKGGNKIDEMKGANKAELAKKVEQHSA